MTGSQPDEPYRLRIAASASRDLHNRLPEAVAFAAIERILGPLLADPHRFGKPLEKNLVNFHGARMGAYRIIYRIVDSERLVVVTRISHRADAYHR